MRTANPALNGDAFIGERGVAVGETMSIEGWCGGTRSP